MTDKTYSLSELARATHTSKTTLLQMLRSATLLGEQTSEGRCEWRIAHQAAVASGLSFEHEPSIDDAVRACITDGVDPVLDLIRTNHVDVLVRLDRIESSLAGKSHSKLSIGARVWAWLARATVGQFERSTRR